MCDKTVGWEPDNAVEGPHNLKPISCDERNRRLIARNLYLEQELIAVRGRQFEGEVRADIIQGRILDPRLDPEGM